MTGERKTLAICLPQQDLVSSDFSMSLAQTMMHIAAVDCGLSDVIWVRGKGSVLPQLRQGIAERAIEKRSATHLLWIDSDHSFPPHTANQLLSHNRPFVGINATTRVPPILNTATKKPGERLVTNALSKGLERVHRVGFGIALVEARVFLAMKKPWFSYQWLPDGTDEDKTPRFLGEDNYFCDMARAAGFHPMVDHDLTRETSHVGSVPWAVDMIQTEEK